MKFKLMLFVLGMGVSSMTFAMEKEWNLDDPFSYTQLTHNKTKEPTSPTPDSPCSVEEMISEENVRVAAGVLQEAGFSRSVQKIVFDYCASNVCSDIADFSTDDGFKKLATLGGTPLILELGAATTFLDRDGTLQKLTLKIPCRSL